jgi:hypothetical protein
MPDIASRKYCIDPPISIFFSRRQALGGAIHVMLSDDSMLLFSLHLGQDLGNESQQVIQGVEMPGLPRLHMLDPALESTLLHRRLGSELYDKSSVGRQ